MKVHKSWQKYVQNAFESLSEDYKFFLHTNKDYFPNYDNFLNAFKTLPKTKTKAILFGQDPYPREISASGYAFIDMQVKDIFAKKGLSLEVNKATSLRNFIKMQLKAQNILQNPTQQNIAKLDKQKLIYNMNELKNNFEKQGILLLNKALIFTQKSQTSLHVKEFTPFFKTLLASISLMPLDIILFGNIAKNIQTLLPKEHNFKLISMPHPYNVSFINNKNALEYFSCKNLLKKE